MARTPLHGSRPPFKLSADVVYFHDWRYVDHGGYHWRRPDGQSSGYFVPEPIPPMRYDYEDMPLGIRLEVKPAERSEPILRAPASDIILFGGSLIQQDGLYRLWYDVWPVSHVGQPYMGMRNVVRYLESQDGTTWRAPDLGLVEYEGSSHNNIVYGDPLTRASGYHGGCVFQDPSAPASERFKCFHLGRIDREGVAAYRTRYPQDVDPFQFERDHVSALYGAVSPDGIHWTPIAEPLLVQTSDTHNICAYDANLGQYVAFVRTWYLGRRSIGRSATDDFHHFPLPEEIFWPDAMEPPYDLWYVNGKTLMPGTSDYHLMFPMRWSLIDDHFEFRLASSPDGIVWGWIPGDPVAQPGPAGAWDGGVVVPGYGLVDLPGDRTGMLVEGSPYPHKHPRPAGTGSLGWASWPKERLVALKADQVGSFALFPLQVTGRTVHLNFKTTFAGHVRVEAVDAKGQVLPGRSFADCDPLSGDHLDQVVSWHGMADLGHQPGDAVTLRFQLRTAELYAVHFR